MTMGGVGLFGLVVRNFLNVCIHRLPQGESAVAPGSRCPGCGAHIYAPALVWKRECRIEEAIGHWRRIAAALPGAHRAEAVNRLRRLEATGAGGGPAPRR